MDLPDPGIKPGSPALQADSLPTELSGKPGWLCRPSSTRSVVFQGAVVEFELHVFVRSGGHASHCCSQPMTACYVAGRRNRLEGCLQALLCMRCFWVLTTLFFSLPVSLLGAGLELQSDGSPQSFPLSLPFLLWGVNWWHFCLSGWLLVSGHWLTAIAKRPTGALNLPRKTRLGSSGNSE